jgi:hypothetical protein
MTPRERLRALLSGAPVDRILVDVGTSTLTALRPSRPPSPWDGRRYADPVMHLEALDESGMRALGSQTRRCGPCFRGANLDDEGGFLDRDGVRWIWADGEPAPLHHPHGAATLTEVLRSRRAPLASIEAPLCLSDPNRALVVVADAPTAGILDSSFRSRGYFELIDDTVANWPMANALFDHATTAIIADYRTMLTSLPAAPDIVVYGDDLAHDRDLYFSEEQFAFFMRPRLARVFSTIRSIVPSEILFHSCGASLPVLKEVTGLGVRIVNFQPTALGMAIDRVRQALGPDIVFHGVLDFVGLSRALSDCDRKAIEPFIDAIVAGWPMIAAPADNLPARIGAEGVRAATSFLERLDISSLLSGDRSCVEDAFRAVGRTTEAAAARG